MLNKNYFKFIGLISCFDKNINNNFEFDNSTFYFSLNNKNKF